MFLLSKLVNVPKWGGVTSPFDGLVLWGNYPGFWLSPVLGTYIQPSVVFFSEAPENGQHWLINWLKLCTKHIEGLFSTWHWQVTGNRVALGPKSVQCSWSGSGQVSKSIAGRVGFCLKNFAETPKFESRQISGEVYTFPPLVLKPWFSATRSLGLGVPRLPTSCHTRLSSRISSWKNGQGTGFHPWLAPSYGSKSVFKFNLPIPYSII